MNAKSYTLSALAGFLLIKNVTKKVLVEYLKETGFLNPDGSPNRDEKYGKYIFQKNVFGSPFPKTMIWREGVIWFKENQVDKIEKWAREKGY